jgi:hypothetical protein
VSLTQEQRNSLIAQVRECLAKIAEYKRLTFMEQYKLGQALFELKNAGEWVWGSQSAFFQANFPGASHSTLYAAMRLVNHYPSLEEAMKHGTAKDALHAPVLAERRKFAKIQGKKAMESKTLDGELQTLANIENTYLRKVEEVGKEVVLNGTFKQRVEFHTRLKRARSVLNSLWKDIETAVKEPA